MLRMYHTLRVLVCVGGKCLTCTRLELRYSAHTDRGWTRADTHCRDTHSYIHTYSQKPEWWSPTGEGVGGLGSCILRCQREINMLMVEMVWAVRGIKCVCGSG